MKHACLLRAVNVSGHNVIKSAALRDVFESLGFDGVTTYIQSGNIVFEANRKNHAPAIEAALAKIGIDTVAVMRTHSDLLRIANGNPWPDAERVHVIFLAKKTKTRTLDAPVGKGEAFEIANDVIYVSYPEGSGNSKLTPAWFEKKLGIAGTARNLRTLAKMIALTA